MEVQQSYKSLKEIINSVKEGINKRIQKENNKSLEERIDEKIKPHVSRLYYISKKLAENVKEKYNLPIIDRAYISTGLYSNKFVNGIIKNGYLYLTADIYSKDKVIECKLDKLASTIKCAGYGDKSSSELSNSVYLMDGIKDSVSNTFYKVFPGVLKNSNKPYTVISSNIYVYPYNSMKKIPEIIRYSDLFRYNDGMLNVTVINGSNTHSKLYSI
jgi:hypothetical protein